MFVKCDSHGGAVDNSRADGWSMLTARRGSSHSLQAPRSRRLLPRPALLGQGTGTTLLGPTGTPSFPIDLSSSPHLGAKPGVLGGVKTRVNPPYPHGAQLARIVVLARSVAHIRHTWQSRVR